MLFRMSFLAPFLFLFLFYSPGLVQAHPYSASYTTLQLNKEDTKLTYAIDELSVIELTNADQNKNGMLDPEEFESVKNPFSQIIKEHVSIKINGEKTEWTTLEDITLQREGDASKVVLHASYPPVSSLQSISLLDQLYMNDPKTNYVDLLTIQYGTQNSTAALSGKDRTWTMLLSESDWAGLNQVEQQKLTESEAAHPAESVSGWYSFFTLGMNHILGGYDHLLFLFSLLLARQTFKQYAMVITAFTIAHSLTLTLTVLGWIDVPPAIVEPAIALSICYVAIENMVRKQVNNRWLVTFLFGLIHGMGFADLLKEMQLPKSELAVAIFSFNLGIETVQLAIVALLFPVLVGLARWKHSNQAIRFGSAIALFLGGIWLAERLFFA